MPFSFYKENGVSAAKFVVRSITRLITETCLGREITSRGQFKHIIPADKTVEQKFGKLCLEQLNLLIFYEVTTLSEVHNSIFGKFSAAEPGTCWCNFLKTPGHGYREQSCIVQEVRTSHMYTQPTAYHIQILPWILEHHLKSHWLQVTYISFLTWNDIVLHYFAATIPLKCLWLSLFWLVKYVESLVYSERHKIKISLSLGEKCQISLPQNWKDI